MPRKIKIDGKLTLNGTKNRCEQTQRAGFKLTKIKFDTEINEGKVFNINRADFDDALSVDIRNELTFVIAKDSDKLKDIKDAHPGLTFILESRIFVKNNVERVVVFGKQV